jgi:zinc protease
LFPAVAVVVAALVFSSPAVGRDATTSGPAPPQKIVSIEGVTEYCLANGLRVLLYPDPSTSRVSVICTVFVGSRHEGFGETGMAHLLEHMNFKGTPTIKDVDRALNDHGAASNAGTSRDQTKFEETLPGTDANLEFAVRLEGDRLMNTVFRREDLASEMTVVRNEFEMYENDPTTILQQRVLNKAFEWHNYGKAVIGNRSDIERIPVERLEAFYRKHYRPDNAMLIVTGKFVESKALEYVARHFGPLKNPAAKLDQISTEEPAQDGERSVALRRVGTNGVVCAAYHIPAAAHPDFAPLTILGRVLGASSEGRLYKTLVATKKSSGIGADAWNMHDPGVFLLKADVNQGQSADEVRRTLLDATEGFGTTQLTEDEVQQARAEMVNGWDQLGSDVMAQALCHWAGWGDWRLLFLHRDRLKKVSAADVHRVAAKYLVRSNRTVGEYVPVHRRERADVPATPDLTAMLKDFAGGSAIARGEVFDPTPENLEKRARRVTLASGVKAALLPRKTRSEMVTLSFTLSYGNGKSLAGLQEACEFLPVMMLKGTRRHDGAGIKRELIQRDSAGISAVGNTGTMGFSAACKREHLPEVVKLLGEILREPSFPEKDLETHKRARIEGLRSQLKDPLALATGALDRALSPRPATDIHYTPTTEEQIKRVEAITLEQVRNLYVDQVGAESGVLVVVGDFDPDAIVRQFDAVLGGWTATVPCRAIAGPPMSTVDSGSIVIETPDKENAVYVAGHQVTLGASDPDSLALAMGSQIFGNGGPPSRLWNRVREKDGLSYHVEARFLASEANQTGGFGIVALCNPANMSKVRRAVADELEKLLKDGVTRDELEAAKKSILTSRETFSDAEISSILTSYALDSKAFVEHTAKSRKIGDLNVDQVNAALRKYLRPNKLVIVEAGAFREAEARRK